MSDFDGGRALSHAFLKGGGALADLIGVHRWEETPLGAIADWPQSLKTTIGLILRSPVPLVTLWGESGIMIYNDAYATFAGKRHPSLLGSEVRKGWPEVAAFNDHVMKVVLGGGTLAFEDQELVLYRTGEAERLWLNLDYSPVLNEAGEPAGVIAIVVETTAKVRAERRISGERERLALMFERAPGFMATLRGPDYVFEAANPAYRELVGHPDIVGKPLLDALPEVADQGFVEILDGVYRTGKPFIGREVPFLVNGPADSRRQVFLDFLYQPIEEDGEISGIFVTGYDVTELRSTQDRLRLAQQAGHVGSFELWPSTRRITVSEEFCRIWGLDPVEDLSVDTLLAMVHPDDAAIVGAEHSEISTDSMGYAEYRILRADTGEERWLARRGEGLRDGSENLRFAGVVYDITDRKQNEQKLRGLAETLEQRVAERTAERDRMWRLSTDVMLVADFEGRFQAVNPAWKQLFDWNEEELYDRRLREFLHPDDFAATMAEMDKLAEGVKTLSFENRYRHRDGSYRWLAWTVVSDGRFLHGVGRNVQAEKEAQQALGIAQEALRQSQKMEAVGQLTGGIAHDFNNLLTVVTGNIDMATRAMEAAGVGDPRSRRALENAMKGAERAASLTQRLLAFSRRQPLAPRALDVDRLAQGMSEMLNRSLGETVRLEIITTPGLWRVEADPNQLESAILNLAVNARDSMPDGGQLVIETANARIDDAYTAAHAEVAAGQYVVLAVTDTGTGMSKEVAARVFEPFFTTKDVGKGTGLGLSMVYGFVKQSGGHVKIYSEEGQGTTVKIYLPRLLTESGAEAEGAAPAPGLEVSVRRETILAVEDDDDVRAYTVESLRDLGYRVLEAHDGPSALRLLERREAPIDLLFTDVVMPGMSGSALAEAARLLQPNLKVLFTSGYTRNAIAHHGRLDPGVEMIAKPFTYAALGQKVRDILDAGRTNRILVVEAEPTVRALAVEGLRSASLAVDEAATAIEALGMIRSAQGRYDVVLIDQDLPDRRGDALMIEVRALHADLVLLLACNRDEDAHRATFAGDPCSGVIAKPYTAERLVETLRGLETRCERASESDAGADG